MSFVKKYTINVTIINLLRFTPLHGNISVQYPQ